jgi:hypothetical protein
MTRARGVRNAAVGIIVAAVVASCGTSSPAAPSQTCPALSYSSFCRD